MRRTLTAWSSIVNVVLRTGCCSSMLHIVLQTELELVRFDHKTAKTGFDFSQAKCERLRFSAWPSDVHDEHPRPPFSSEPLFSIGPPWPCYALLTLRPC
jgi:hypothetical protein